MFIIIPATTVVEQVTSSTGTHSSESHDTLTLLPQETASAHTQGTLFCYSITFVNHQ